MIVYNDYSARVMARLRSKESLINRLLLEDIHRAANKTTPLKDGDLREQVSKLVDGQRGIITWKVPYASYQERGMRYDGSRVVKHYTTAGTDKEFAKKAVKDTITPRNLINYYSKNWL